MVFSVFLPTVVMAFAYIRMGLTLYRSEFASKSKQQAQINLFQTCVIMMVLFTLSGFNISVAVILFTVGVYKNLNGSHYTISVMLMIFNQCINPYIYCIRYKEFQNQMKKLLKFKKQSKHVAGSSVSN